jgi:hypothetical protein
MEFVAKAVMSNRPETRYRDFRQIFSEVHSGQDINQVNNRFGFCHN